MEDDAISVLIPYLNFIENCSPRNVYILLKYETGKLKFKIYLVKPNFSYFISLLGRVIWVWGEFPIVN